MKVRLLLKTESAEASRQFYEDELKMFKLHGEIWENSCTLQSVDNDMFSLSLASFYNAPPALDTAMPIFTLVVKSCDREFARLRATHFGSGGRLVPDKNGVLEVFDYPAGKNFIVEDPSGNRLLIAEDYQPLQDE